MPDDRTAVAVFPSTTPSTIDTCLVLTDAEARQLIRCLAEPDGVVGFSLATHHIEVGYTDEDQARTYLWIMERAKDEAQP